MLAEAIADWVVDLLGTAGLQAVLRLVRDTPADREIREVLATAVDTVVAQAPAQSRDSLRAALQEHFSQPPRLPIGSRLPVHEALRASIDAQLEPLADTAATPVAGQSALDVIGVDLDWLAGTLTKATISAVLRAAASSGIAPLAAQANAESIGAQLDAVLRLLNAPPAIPGLASMSALPPPVAGFTGREDQLAELRASWPADGPAPVVWSIAGPAGVGKSALAIQCAHYLAAEFPDGQFYLDLRGTEDDARLDPLDGLRQFLRALGVAHEEIPASTGERVALLRSQLANRRLIILLDNAHDEKQVRPLLPGSPGCLVLITSRRPLAALDTPHPPMQLGMLAEPDGVQMLSRLAGPDRVLAQPGQSAELVRLCGGLPLALRIAAGRLRSRPQWPVAEILRRLAEERGRLAGLRVGDLDVRASFMLSYRELTPAQALLFRRLGILPGTTFDLQLATAVGTQTVIGGSASAISITQSPEDAIRRSDVVSHGPEALQAEEAAARERAEAELDELVDAQLIEGPAREYYRMHDLVRLFAAELLRDGPDGRAEELMATFNYVEWAHVQAAAVAAWLILPPQDIPARSTGGFRSREEAVDWLERNHLSVAEAVRMASAAHNDDAAIELAQLLAHLFMRRGLWASFDVIHDPARAAAQRSGDPSAEAEILFQRGFAQLSSRSFAAATASLEEGLAQLPPDQAGKRRAEIRTIMSNAFACSGRLDAAAACLAEAEQLMQADGGATGHEQARVAAERATLLELCGDVTGAAAHFERALQLSREAGESLQQAILLERIGSVYVRQHRRAAAIQCCQESLALCRDPDDVVQVKISGDATLSLARAQLIDGVRQEAIELLDQAVQIFQRLQLPGKEAEVLYYQSIANKKLGKWAAAEESWTRAMTLVSRADAADKSLLRALERARPRPPVPRQQRTQQARKTRKRRHRRS